jgi:hypothetical protein
MECNESGMNVISRFDGDHHCTASSWQVYFQNQFEENQRFINAQMKLMKENKTCLQRNASLQGTRRSDLESNNYEGQEQSFMIQHNSNLQEEYAHQCLAEFAPMLKVFFGGDDDDESTASADETSQYDADATWSLL